MTKPTGKGRRKPNPELTQRERDALVYLSKGFTNKGIARLLEVSVHTINDNVKSIFRKLDVNNRVEAAVRALKEGVI